MTTIIIWVMIAVIWVMIAVTILPLVLWALARARRALDQRLNGE